MTKILITEYMDKTAIDLLRDVADVDYSPDLGTDAEGALESKIAGVNGLIVGEYTKVDAPLIKLATDLKVVARLGVSVHNIAVSTCEDRKIAVEVAAGENSVSVAEYVMATSLMLLRGAYLATDQLIGGVWPHEALIGREAKGRTIGLVGYGAIGQAVARRANAFGMQVLAHDPHVTPESPVWDGVRRADFDYILEHSDILSLHVPVTPQTRRVIGKQELKRMKSGAILINSAGATLVDEIALVDALRSRHLAGAALDVFENEPLNKVQGGRFTGLGNVILTPHIAGVTHDANLEVGLVTARNVMRALRLKTSRKSTG